MRGSGAQKVPGVMIHDHQPQVKTPLFGKGRDKVLRRTASPIRDALVRQDEALNVVLLLQLPQERSDPGLGAIRIQIPVLIFPDQCPIKVDCDPPGSDVSGSVLESPALRML